MYTIRDYYQSTLQYVSTTALELKTLRNNIDFFQKICISQKGLIQFVNQVRGTNLMGKLVTVLDASYLTDAYDPIRTIHEWLKPINVNTIHASDLLEQIVSIYEYEVELDEKGQAALKEYIKTTLEEFIKDLANSGMLGYSNSAQFIRATQHRIREGILINNFSDVYAPMFQDSYSAHLTAEEGEVDEDFDQRKLEETSYRLFEELKPVIKNSLLKFLADSQAKNPHREIAYNAPELIAYVRQSVIDFFSKTTPNLRQAVTEVNYEEDTFNPILAVDLVDQIPQVPLKHVGWGDWLTKLSFSTVGFVCAVDYFGDWGFLDKAKWAASVGISDFGLGFKVLIGTAFTLAAIQATRKLYAAYWNDPQIGNDEKVSLPYIRATLVAESIFYAKAVVKDVKGNVATILDSLSLIAAKAIGAFGIASSPVSVSVYDTPVTIKSDEELPPSCASRTVTRIKNAVAAAFSRIPGNRYVLSIIDKIARLASTIFEGLNDFVNYDKDGFDKLYKIVIPGLELGERILTNYGLATSGATDKCIAALKAHRDLIYATKFFGCIAGWKDSNKGIPNWIVQNPATKNWEIRGPLYAWDKTEQRFKLQWLSPSAWSKVLLDVANFVEPTRFMRKYEIYHFNDLVNLGSQWAQKTINVYGYTAKLGDVPYVRELFGTVKNLPVSISAFIDGNVQFWNGFVWNGFVKGNKSEFEIKNLLQFGANVGKLAIIGAGYADNWKFETLCLVTGLFGGAKTLIANYENRGKFKLIAAAT